MKRITLLAILALVFLKLTSGRVMAAYDTASGSMPPTPPTNTIGIYDDRFDAKTLHVPLGMSVLWLNYGRHIHSVTSIDGLFDSGEMVPGQSFTMTFTQVGTYHYFCRQDPSMSAVIIVGP